MKTIAIISQKGGVGKTTIATALSVAFEEGGLAVALIDLDPQASACFWSDRRVAAGRSTFPVRDVNHNRLAHALAALGRAGADVVLIDCPPQQRDIADAAIEAADLVLVPTRAEALDIHAMAQTVRLAQQMGKQPVVVLNFCRPQGTEAGQAKQVVAKTGAAIAPVDIHLRKIFPRAQQDGATATEHEPDGKAADEIRRLAAYCTTTLKLKENTHAEV
jgi:chromosome partitioning protein